MFILTENHIKLLERLYFSTIYSMMDNSLIPCIDNKRPLSNSGIVFEVADILSIYPEDDNWSDDILRTVFINIIEIPAALSIVIHYKTFDPGLYETNFKNYVFKEMEKNLASIEENILSFQEYLNKIKNK